MWCHQFFVHELAERERLFIECDNHCQNGIVGKTSLCERIGPMQKLPGSVFPVFPCVWIKMNSQFHIMRILQISPLIEFVLGIIPIRMRHQVQHKIHSTLF